MAITCPNCGHDNPEGAIICVECEKPLRDLGGLNTMPFPEDVDSVGRPHWGASHFGSDSVLVIHVRGNSAPIITQLDDELLVGRYDPIGGSSPGFDLSPYQAMEQGVSRLHIAIRRQEDSLSLVDLGSANATFLNGQRLIPHQARVLRDGDELRLGRLVLQVYFRHPAKEL